MYSDASTIGQEDAAVMALTTEVLEQLTTATTDKGKYFMQENENNKYCDS